MSPGRARVLVIDDDPLIVRLVRTHLERAGFQVSDANDGQTGLEIAARESPDFIILDLMLPTLDGYEVCRRLRELSLVPVLMLTARGEQVDKLRGFEMGADGLRESDGAGTLAPGHGETGSALGLTMAGRRALAVEVQALAVATEGPPRRQVTGLDLRRFSLIAAVLDQATGLPLFRSELFGASAGGVRLDDPGTDLAVAAAMAARRRSDRSALNAEMRLYRGEPVLPVEGGDAREPLVEDLRVVLEPGGPGRLAIHPAQVPIINAAFAPSAAQIAHAQKIIAAFAAQPGAGAVGIDGKMFDRPHLVRAQALLASVKA